MTTSITHSDWHIVATESHISSSTELDVLNAELGIPLPEMTFGNNSLTLTHLPSGARYSFNPLAALRQVRAGELADGDGAVKVDYAETWLSSRTDPTSNLPLPTTTKTKPYDWTYTTVYSGDLDAESDSTPGAQLDWQPADPENTSHTIPLAQLSQKEPILFYAHIPLFEDELHDNGVSQLIVRIRAMPSSFFVLSRFTLRVDNVLFRTFDTRIYHSFNSDPPLLVRETRGWEAPYQLVKQLLPKKDDLTPLTDPEFIAQSLSSLPSATTQRAGAGSRWRGMGNKVHVAVISKLKS